MRARPLWRISLVTSAEAEEAVSVLLAEVSRRPVSSFTNLENGHATVTVFFDQKPLNYEGMLARLHAGLKWIRACGLNPGQGCRPALQRVRREDWSEAWKKHFSPLEIGSRLLVRPGWSRRKARKGQAVVVLDPGLSFGTGQHPTTAFCLEQLVARRVPGTAQSFLDVGTGSGILAIAAAKLGYGPVEALDNDPEAVRTARLNAQRNRMLRRIQFGRRDIRRMTVRPAAKYSVVCANLISTLLIEERERLLARVKPNGILVLAGVLASEFSSVRKAYAVAGWKLVSSRRENEWRSGTFQRGNDRAVSPARG